MVPSGTHNKSYVNRESAVLAGFLRAMCAGTGAKASPVQIGSEKLSKFLYRKAEKPLSGTHDGFCVREWQES